MSKNKITDRTEVKSQQRRESYKAVGNKQAQNLCKFLSDDSHSNSRKCILSHNKLAPYGTDSRLLLTANFSHMTQKTCKYQKSGPDKLQVLCSNLSICGHLPATIINGEEIAFEYGRIPTFKGSWPWPWIGHTAYHHASVIDLYLHTEFH